MQYMGTYNLFPFVLVSQDELLVGAMLSLQEGGAEWLE